MVDFVRNEALPTIHPRWRGNPVSHGRFFNREHRWQPGMGPITQWRFSRNPWHLAKKYIRWNPKVIPLHSLEEVKGNALVWLGHNSFFLQLGGKRLMIDPVFGNFPFVKRESPCPASPEVFREIDYLLISHDHFDHLDKPSVKKLVDQNPTMRLFCGLGTGQLLNSWFPALEVIEAGWYQQYTDEGGLKLTFLPAQHWSKRSFNDGGSRLWGAFLLQADGITIYNSGDTAYASHFRELPEIIPHIDYCMIGIGAYQPRFFMKPNHISPFDALTAVSEMHARVAIPMHYGTFNLSDEPMFNPPHVFEREAENRGIQVQIPQLGEILPLSYQQ